MAGDRARLTYAGARKYREVISQQGRVSLEADLNESQRVVSENTRLHALDFVGPHGTPDDGYKPGIAGGDIQVGPGTMFVGGLRTTTETIIAYSNQADWRDTALPQTFTQEVFRPFNTLAAFEHIVLLLREQELGAVEDPALRDVALGGPDSAARTRLLQRIMAVQAQGRTCAEAEKTTQDFFTTIGLDLNTTTAALEPRSRLKVELDVGAAPATVCDPPAASGYLGADNQLIRVQVVAYNPGTRRGTLLWGYNNASTLFRCKPVAGNAAVALAQAPIGPEYEPRTGQVVQLLLPAAALDQGAGLPEDRSGFAAGLTGYFQTLAGAYQRETKQVPVAVPAYLQPAAGAAPPLLFMRLWEDKVDFELGGPSVALQNTGLKVAISATAGTSIHVGDYWSIAVRPETPNAVYPERLLDAPQPPDGPRMWLCPLGVAAGGNIVADCRLPFDNLPELTARQPGEDGDDGDDCCCLKVTPEDAPNLQDIIDNAITEANGAKLTVRFEEGEYALQAPLIFGDRHSGLALEACSNTRPILLAGRENDLFEHGLILLLGIQDFSATGLKLMVRPVRISDQAHDEIEQVINSNDLSRENIPQFFGFGFRVVQCLSIRIERCDVEFEQRSGAYMAGVLIQGLNGHVHVEDSRFTGTQEEAEKTTTSGILLAPWLQSTDGLLGVSVIEALTISGCQFAMLTLGAIHGDVLFASVTGNISRSVYGSFVALANRDLTLIKDVLGRLNELSDEAQRFGHIYPAYVRSGLRGQWPCSRVFIIGMMISAEKLIDNVGDRRLAATLGDAELEKLRDGKAPFADDQRFVLSGNTFGSYPTAGEQFESGADTVIWDLAGKSPMTRGLVVADLTGNSFRNRGLTTTHGGRNDFPPISAPTLCVIMPYIFNITGNAIGDIARLEVRDNDPPLTGLVVQPLSSTGGVFAFAVANPNTFTVTGNTIFGQTNLNEFPRTEFALPANGFEFLLSWEYSNRVVIP